MTHILAGTEIADDITQGEIWSEITSLSHRDARIQFVREHQELLRYEVVSELTVLVPRLAKADTSKALRVAEIALIIAMRLGNPESLAQSLRAKANALYALGRNKAAIGYHRKAVTLFRSVDNPEQVARTLSSSIQPLILRGYYDQALAAAHEAQAIFETQGNHWRLARVGLNLGNIYDRQDRVEDALKCYERAYDCFSGRAEEDPEGIAVALHNMAVSYVRLNDCGRAMAAFQRARTFALTHDMSILAGQSDYNIGRLHYLRGDYHRALSVLRAARETCSSNGDEYHVALCHLDLSEVYLEFNMSTEACEAAELATASFRKLGMRYERAKAIVNVAIAMSQEENVGRALKLFLQARRMFVSEQNQAFPSIIDLYRALLLVRVGRPVEARELCIPAMKTFRKLKLKAKTIECHLLLACLCLDSDPILAGRHCTRALRSLTRLESPALNCHANTLMGQIHAAAGNENRSYKAYERARQSLERQRNSIHGEELKIAFMKDRVQVYEALVGYCMRRDRQPKTTVEAFKYIEEAKSRSLLDFLSTSHTAAGRGPQANTGYAGRIRDLREELNWFYHKIDLAQLKESSRKEVVVLQAELQGRERELLRLSREYSNDPEEGPRWSAALTIDQVRQALPAESIILEYFQIQERMVVLLLGRDLLEIVSLGNCSEITTLLQSLNFQLSKLRLGPEYGRTFANILLKSIRTHLESLYKTLIDPIRKRMHARHLVIAPHGVLHHLPFQALFNGQQYLIDEFTISYAPSASIYALCQTRSTHRTCRSLIIGIPDQAAPFVQEEVISIASCLPNAELLCGQDATVERLRDVGRESQFIHIATHGHFRRDSPMFSRLRLGGSYLSLYDLYQLELPAELITLSGCSTGLNVVAAGDELLGLARGLIHAGAETSLLTMWDVQDRSAAQLMTSFYQQLGRGERKAEALQHAMQQVRSEYPHPYHWAPFNLVGKG